MINNDIVMFCESWTRASNELRVEGFAKPFCIHRKRKKGAKRDSGGIVCYFRNKCANGVSVVDWSFDDGFCFKLDKHIFKTNDDVFLLCVYMPSNTSTREDINDRVNCYDELSDQVARISKKGVVVIVGDFNARSGVKKDCLIGNVNDNDTINDVLDRAVPLYDFEQVNDMQISANDLVANDISIERKNKDKG